MVPALALLFQSCGPKFTVENHVAHPLVTPPPAEKPWQLGMFWQKDNIAGHYDTVKLFHETSGVYAEFRWKNLGAQVQTLNWFIHPGISVSVGDPQRGTVLRVLTSYSGKTPDIVPIWEVSSHFGDDKVRLLCGWRLGQVPLFGHLDFREDSVWRYEEFRDNANWAELFAGLHVKFSRNFGFFGTLCYGVYYDGIRTYYWPEGSETPRLRETETRFSQFQAGFSAQF